MLLKKLRRAVKDALTEWARKKGIPPPEDAPLAPVPPHLKGDVSLSWALKIAKDLKINPIVASGEMGKNLTSKTQGWATVEAVPPGFDNFTFEMTALHENLQTLFKSPEEYSRQEPSSDRVLIEFVSANPTGPLHLGHGRAASLGDSLSRIFKHLGHPVSTEFYVNDSGRQVELLGQSLQAGKMGHPIPEEGYRGEHIAAIAKSFPPESQAWPVEKWTQAGIEYFMGMQRKDLEDFEVHFDTWFRESELYKKNALQDTLEYLKQKGMAHEKDGAVWFGSEGSEEEDRVLIRSDGRPTYFLPDIAYHRDKLRRGFTKLIDIWGADHHGYVPRMRAAISALGSPDAFEPIIHQLVHLFRGNVAVKMSKRSGEFVTLREVVEEVGKDACRFFFAMRNPNAHLNFDVELAQRKSQENPVYYIQYVHARICSIFREAQKRSFDNLEPRTSNLELLKEIEERSLLVKLVWFPEILRTCAKDLSPHHLANYLLELAGLFHPFYEKHRVVDEKNAELSKARLALCEGARSLIEKGLWLLGVSAPQQM
ncbi:MAG: arginine--tRNA ligase [Elusimicrobia bacterium]|nr:arginine--tRNA ligase [Elusimicrobiota bacterium]